jgi:crotonobetainyl-CoA:carnitine CoA-transferase CaiB-like acyl-CoA transferase
MDHLGIGYATLRAANPAIVLASVSGFGQPSVLPSPYSELPAMAVMIEAVSGLMDQAGEADRPPALLGFPVGDIFAGALAASGILMALRTAEATGLGQHVDVAMFDAAVSLNERALTHLSTTGQVLSRNNKAKMMIGPLDVYRTRDGYVTVAAAVQNTWTKFCRALDIAALREDERFQTGADRARNRDSLKELVEDWTSTRSTAEVLEALQGAEVPAAPVRGVDEVFTDPGVRARQMLVAVDHPIAGRVELTGNPIKLSSDPRPGSAPPPLLGEHTDAILRDVLHLGADEIAQLHATRVI